MAMKTIKVIVSDETAATLDHRRGLVAVSAWVRDLILRELNTPAPPGLPARAPAGSVTAPSPGYPPAAIPADVPKHRHVYDKTGQTRPKGNGKGVEHEKVCGGCFDIKWEN